MDKGRLSHSRLSSGENNLPGSGGPDQSARFGNHSLFRRVGNDLAILEGDHAVHVLGQGEIDFTDLANSFVS